MSASKKRTFQDLEYNFIRIHKYARQLQIDMDPNIGQLYQDETARLNKKLKRCKEREIHNERMRLEIVAERQDTERKINTTALFMTNLKSGASELLRVTRELARIAEGGACLKELAKAGKEARRVWGFCQFTGVYWDKGNGKWHAQITHNGRNHYVGVFKDEVEAAKAWDAQARSLRGADTKTNFNLDGSECGKKNNDTSKFMGVSKSCGKWRASIRGKLGNYHHIGFFEDEVEAAKAYDAKARSLRGATSFTNFNLDGIRHQQHCCGLSYHPTGSLPANPAALVVRVLG